MQEHIYRGKASAYPIPHTQYKHKSDSNTFLDLSIFLNFSEERPDKEIPRLAIGDFVTVDLGNYKAAATSEHLWTGRLVAPTLSTGIGQVCMIINRPINRGTTEILDEESYTTWDKKKLIVTVDQRSMSKSEQYHDTQVALNDASKDDAVKLYKMTAFT